MVTIPKHNLFVRGLLCNRRILSLQVPLDVSSVIIEGYVIAYKRCGLDTQYKEKMLPGVNTKCHAITGTRPCSLYEVKVAACANEGTGLYSTPVIIRTGGNDSYRILKFFFCHVNEISTFYLANVKINLERMLCEIL